MRLTLSLSPFATQRNCLPSESPSGPRPTWKVFWAAPSTRVTVPSSVLATQTTPRIASTSSGLRPTGIAAPMRSFATALSRVSELPVELETQTVLPSTAMPSGPSPAGMVLTTSGAVAFAAPPPVWSLPEPLPSDPPPPRRRRRRPRGSRRRRQGPARRRRPGRARASAPGQRARAVSAAQPRALPAGFGRGRRRRGLGRGRRRRRLRRDRRRRELGGPGAARPVARLRSGCDGSAPVSAARAARPRSPADG